MMKKAIWILFVLVIAVTMTACDALRSYQFCYSDITAYINHHPIPSYAWNGKTVIRAEDLAFYGFDVSFDSEDMTLFIDRNSEVFVDGIDFKKLAYPNGFVAGEGGKSNVKVVINGNEVYSFAHNGSSMIAMEDLGCLGDVFWVPEFRAVKLWVDGINIPEFRTVDYAGPVVDPSRPMIALTFDDGPGVYTDEILDALELYGGRATFFVIGENAERFPGQVKRASDMGMEIANHTYSHEVLSNLPEADVKQQIEETDRLVHLYTGKKPSLLRPPGGKYNESVCEMVDKPLVMWSVDTFDWNIKDSFSIAETVMTAKDGDIVLMHDIYESTAEAVKSVIADFAERGYQLVTVSELAYYKGHSLSPGMVVERLTERE